MKKARKLTCMLLLMIGMAATLAPAPKGEAANADPIKTGEFIELMAKTAKLEADQEAESPYLEAAKTAGLVKDGEFKNLEAIITNTDAAVLANRTEELLNGTKYDERKYDLIVSRKRISDLGKIATEKRPDVIKVYMKGIMIGTGNGKCSQDRRFNGSEKLKKSTANLIAARIKTPSKRRKLSPDGQLIRTTNLPKNYKDYEYILESFPNSFYEAKFRYQSTKYYYEPKELEDYASPAKVRKMVFSPKLGLTQGEVMDRYLYDWCDKVEKNLWHQFNADYRTIDKEWINGIRSTYYVFGDPENDRIQTREIEKYVKEMKKNKVIVEASKIVVEPSSQYYASGDYIRAYVKFRVVSGPIQMFDSKVKGVVLSDIFCGEYAYVKDFEKGVWLERYFDINVGTRNGSSDGSDYAISGDDLIDAE